MAQIFGCGRASKSSWAAIAGGAVVVMGASLNTAANRGGGGAADQPEGDGMGAAMAPMMGRQFAEEYTFLERMVGTWDMKATFEFAPGMQTTSTGTAKKWIGVGGKCLMDETKLSLDMGGMVVPMEGSGWLTFNNATGEYESAWVDSFDTHVQVQRGDMRDDNSIHLEGESNGQGGPAKSRNVYRFTGPDAFQLEFWSVNPMGGDDWVKIGTIEYTRAG